MLEGDLSDFSLPDVLRLLAFTAKSGQLGLRQGDAAGRVVLVDGHVRDVTADARRLPLARRLLGTGRVDPAALRAALTRRAVLPSDAELAALLVEQGHLDAETAGAALRDQAIDGAFELLRWHAGSFRFDTAEGEAKQRLAGMMGPLDLTVDALLAEVDQRREAWRDLTERTGDAAAVAMIVRPPAAADVHVEPDGWELLALIDGRRRVEELIELSGRGEFATRRTLAALCEQGVVEVGTAGDGSPTERLLTAHRELTALEAKLGGAPGRASERASDRAWDPARVAAGPGAPTASPSVAPAAATPPWAGGAAAASTSGESASGAPAAAGSDAAADAGSTAAWSAERPATRAATAPAGEREDTLFGGRLGDFGGRLGERGADRTTEPAAATSAPPGAAPGVPTAGTEPSSAGRSAERSDDDVDREATATSTPAMAAPDRARPPVAAAAPTPLPPPGVTPLRTRVRADRIATDPTIDPDLVTRLIDGVERL